MVSISLSENQEFLLTWSTTPIPKTFVHFTVILCTSFEEGILVRYKTSAIALN